jgi:hypothetical protein
MERQSQPNGGAGMPKPWGYVKQAYHSFIAGEEALLLMGVILNPYVIGIRVCFVERHSES